MHSVHPYIKIYFLKKMAFITYFNTLSKFVKQVKLYIYMILELRLELGLGLRLELGLGQCSANNLK